ncbi:hypothetical protein [Usitatibacter palustris]|nr:hypothetical protein [Usitatibacter palustris]
MTLAVLAGLGASLPASAFCVYNELKDKEVSVLQEDHPDYQRNDRRFKVTLKPGANSCCEFKNLDCNPNGRQNSMVNFEVTLGSGDTPMKCGPAGVPDKAKVVKVSGDGVLRIVANPRHGTKGHENASPYIARVWTHDKQDVTGPAGLPCR